MFFSEQDFPDHRPVTVQVMLDNLPVGYYRIVIHTIGDIGDGLRSCDDQELVGHVHVELHEFQIKVTFF